MKRIHGLAALAIVLALAAPGQAGLMATLTPVGANPLALQVGDTLNVEVRLTGVTGQPLSLDVRVLIPDTLFEVVGGITVGSIVPNPGGFVPNQSADFVDGVYDSIAFITNPAINQDGVFYTFSLRAKAIGSGTLEFDVGASLATDENGINQLTVGQPLAVNVSDGVLPIPEPSTGLVALLSLAGGLIWKSRQKKAGHSAGR